MEKIKNQRAAQLSGSARLKSAGEFKRILAFVDPVWIVEMTEWNLTETYDFDRRSVRYGVRGAGLPVVLVHGTPWSSSNLRHLIEVLSENFTLYFYDLIGYSQSDNAPGDVSLAIQNQVLDRLPNHWKLENPAIVGHDIKGTTVLRMHGIKARLLQDRPYRTGGGLPRRSPFFQARACS